MKFPTLCVLALCLALAATLPAYAEEYVFDQPVSAPYVEFRRFSIYLFFWFKKKKNYCLSL